MSGDELRSTIIWKTEFEATSRNNIIYRAIEHARLVELGIVKPNASLLGEQEPELTCPAFWSKMKVSICQILT